jgi:hypothetical protein
MGKEEGRKPLERPRRKQVGDIKINVREIWWCGMDWFFLAQNIDRGGIL